MPSKDYFNLNGYYLRQFPGSPNWYACWFDTATRQTKRTSCGTADFEAAKVELARLVTVFGDLDYAKPEEVTLHQVFERYKEHHAKGLPSAADQKRHLRYCTDFLGKQTTVADFRKARQREFVNHLKGQGHGASYIRRIFATVTAAMNWAHSEEEIRSVPKMIAHPPDEPRNVLLENDQIKAFWGAIQAREHVELRRYVMILLNTGGRPEAVRDITRAQVDLKRSRLDLNPPGRRRTSKGRPLVPITNTLRPWLMAEDRDKVLGRAEKWLGDQWRAARERSGLPDYVIPYAIRHTVSTVLAEANCLPDDVLAFMGWKLSDRMHDWYNHRRYRPDYCKSVVEALDGWMAELGLESETARVAPRAASDTRELGTA